jgi:hypothetical protein
MLDSIHKFAVRRNLYLALCLISLTAIVALALGTYAKPSSAIEIAAGVIPPDMREDGGGREADIISRALRLGDEEGRIGSKQIRFHAEPFGKHWYSYQTNDFYDAVATVPDNLELSGYRSAFYITYRNGVGFVAEEPPRPITSLQQLDGKRVIAFAGAAKVIPGLEQRVPHFKVYIEREDQRTHSWMLLNDQVDGVIADAMIFSYFNRLIFDEGKVRRAAIQFYAQPFRPTCYTMMFRNAEYRDLFNKGLKEMIDNGELYGIDQTYAPDEVKSKKWDVQYLGSGGEAPCRDQHPS